MGQLSAEITAVS